MDEKLEQVRHSAAHLLAHAISHLYPGTKFAIGPATEKGFFYDFLPPENIKEEDLERIEAYMHTLATKNCAIEHYQVSKKEAQELFAHNPFKLELIDGIEGDTVGIAEQDDFKDLCKGGHVPSTGKIQHFKLTSISGAYWRGNKDNQALQRIHGTAFLTAKSLRTYEKQRAEALKYDHRKLGKEMELFSFHKEGVGFPFFHPKGQTIINTLSGFMRNLLGKHSYQEIATPTMLSQDLWKQSGHYEHYHDNMYFSHVDEDMHAIKPMNCPGAFLIYNNRPRSYRELPLKLSEFGHVHRHELSGVLHGLMRVRAFTIDDTHIFCMPEQIEEQIITVLNLVQTTMHAVGFEKLKIGLSTKPEKAMGSDEVWEQAIDALKNALEKNGHEFEICEGEGAFYGPKIEVRTEDSLGREWQCGTIQVDFFQPQNFDMSYIAPSGKKERPVIIHHAIYGSFERFLAILLEHHKGKLPFWLSPVQARVLSITDEQKQYAQTIVDALASQEVRVELDNSSDPISGKIKRAQNDRVAWMLVVGQKEQDNKAITLRYRNGKQEFGLSLEQLLGKIQEETPSKI